MQLAQAVKLVRFMSQNQLIELIADQAVEKLLEFDLVAKGGTTAQIIDQAIDLAEEELFREVAHMDSMLALTLNLRLSVTQKRITQHH